MNIESLQSDFNKRNKKKKKHMNSKIYIMPKADWNVDCSEFNHYGIKSNNKKRPPAIKPTWAL